MNQASRAGCPGRCRTPGQCELFVRWSGTGAIRAARPARHRADRRTPQRIAAHRSGWLTATAKAAAWPGSAIVIVVLVVLAAAFLAARRQWRPAIMLAVALAGSVILNITVQHLVGRSRPPAALSIGHHAGPAFPFRQATTAIACYGMLAVILAADRAPRIRALLRTVAAAVTALAGASQVYLGANWLTDILGGWALGALWIAIILTVELRPSRPRRRSARARQPKTRPRPTRRQQAQPSTAAELPDANAMHSPTRGSVVFL
jgi:undecaprenyl-diphosphatase